METIGRGLGKLHLRTLPFRALAGGRATHEPVGDDAIRVTTRMLLTQTLQNPVIKE